MAVKEKTKVCNFCGPYEECMQKYHTLKHIRNLLVDAGIIEDTTMAFAIWMNTNHKDNDKEKDLLGYDPRTVWGVFEWRVAKYVRSIL